ncbi:hypothetical protein [Ruminiclostridium cellobioparum]|uniref:hypothetical protein n=1 Tax=Ruminiclostridium cellobioparum TaxID=29355 RepID=UPI0028B235A6|nr:hypothetical protein [Ruminiclostridium cellobioparum]
MKRKFIFAMPVFVLCCLLFSVKAFAATASDIEINVASPIDTLRTESGVVAVEQFPAEIPIHVTAKTGTLTDIELEYDGENRTIPPDYTLTVESKKQCGPYTITAKTDQGAVLTITANVVYQVKATYDTRYRTIGMNVKEIYEGDTLLKSFPEPQRIDLVNANTVADHENERIAGWIGKHDGGTYTLKGSLVVEIHNISTGGVYGTYDTDTDFDTLTGGFGWTPKTLIAFETMRSAEITYQAPVKIDVEATWCSEDKQEVYGKLTAQDKGVPELLYPYQTTSVTFHKDDIKLSRNYQYMGLEWKYTPETKEFSNGESKTKTEITQRIHYQIPAADFFFKFKPQDGNDLSVAINVPATVNRGADYSFTVIYMNSGNSPAYDVPLKGTVDGVSIEEIPSIQDFSPNQSKTYTVKRTADTKSDEIHLWANIGVPEGFIDGNLANNTATAIIKVVDPVPEPTPGNPDNPPDNPGQPDYPSNPPDQPPVKKEPCDLSASILAAPTAYEHEKYSFTVSFTNESSMALKDVPLLGKNNETILSRIPETADFTPQETKSYTITGTAGSAGEIYHLWANAEAPEGFTDENPIDNTAVSSIRVIERSTDNPPDNPPSDNPGNPDNPPDNPDQPDNPGNPDNPPDNPDNPDEPGNPDNPGNPDTPITNYCDVWVNLSSPPTVYERESYSFTVYFANSTDKALSDVRLNVAINGKAVPAVPATANFKPFEKKSYLVTSTAGEKGIPIELTAKVLPPAGYEDINPSNNEVSAQIMVLERPYDLDVQRITPDRYKENQSVVTTVKVGNQGSLDFVPGENVTVLFQIPELSFSKRIDAIVMAKDSWNVVSLRWDTPNVQADKNITLIATINPDRSLDNESTTDNNVYTQKAVVQNVTYEAPQESRALPDPPKRNEQPRVTWWEQRYENGQFVWHEYYVELRVSATLDYDTKAKGYLKSGYGYSIKVSTSVSTNYDKPELITAPQTAEVYLPEYRYETAIPLVKEGGQFIFRENPASPFQFRKQYIPVWFPDNKDYIAQLLVTDVHTPGGTLSKWITGGELKIYVVDSMYDDDVTTGDE